MAALAGPARQRNEVGKRFTLQATVLATCSLNPPFSLRTPLGLIPLSLLSGAVGSSLDSRVGPCGRQNFRRTLVNTPARRARSSQSCSKPVRVESKGDKRYDAALLAEIKAASSNGPKSYGFFKSGPRVGHGEESSG